MKDTAGRIATDAPKKAANALLPANSEGKEGAGKSRRGIAAAASEGTNVVTLKGSFRLSRGTRASGIDEIESETSWTEEFDEFADALKQELRPIGLIEGLLAEQVALAAWRLRGSLLAEKTWSLHEATDQHLLGPSRLRCEPLNELRRDTDGASRRLQRAVEQFEGVRAEHDRRTRARSINVGAPRSGERFSPVPDSVPGAERLMFDSLVSDRYPVVKGTRVTVEDVAKLIVEGKSWAEIEHVYPQLCKDDIRSCVRYATEQGVDRDDD